MKLILGNLIMVFALFSQMTESKYIEYLEKTYQKFDIRNIDASDLKKDYILIDTREIEEFNVSHIEGALQISYDDFDLELLKNINKTDTLVLYCSVGYRSSVIAEKLVENGYKNIYNLYGGLFLWANQGRKLVDIENQSTHRVHGYNKYWSRYLYNDQLEKVY